MVSKKAERDRIIEISNALYRASKKVRILRNISWSNTIRDTFLANNASVIPTVEYPPFDPADTLEHVKKARKIIDGDDAVAKWAHNIADKLETAALMLTTRGTTAFFEHSAKLYGTPKDPVPDGYNTAYDLATQFDSIYDKVDDIDFGAPLEACHLAQTVQSEMIDAVEKMFGAAGPEVVLVDELASNAIAGSKRIRIRKTACFTDKDIDQLIHHEAYVHVATSHNGFAQEDLKILVASHPGTTKTQEGLAVFAEMITGSIDLDRMRRLSDRILAVQMAIDGADFIEVFRFYQTKTEHDEQAFENTRRVFRGGVLTGGAPFTKDIVYLDGLLRVHNFLRIIVSAGRADLIRLLFTGKLDLEDIPVLCHFADLGLLRSPKYLPPWVEDLRFLVSYLAYSTFLNRIDLATMKRYYTNMLNQTARQTIQMV